MYTSLGLRLPFFEGRNASKFAIFTFPQEQNFASRALLTHEEYVRTCVWELDFSEFMNSKVGSLNSLQTFPFL